MPTIRFIQHDGAERTIEAESGRSVMQNAVDNLVIGIVGECGGCCSCATCHGYVDPRWAGALPPKSEEEAMILEGAMHTQDNSRLTCQLTVRPELDGMVVRLPPSQF